MLGLSVFAATLSSGQHWQIAMLLSISAGVAAGALTGTLNAYLGVTPLLSGILTAMIAYSLCFRVLGGQPNAALDGFDTMYSLAKAIDAQLSQAWAIHPWQIGVSALFAVGAGTFVIYLLLSEFGLVLRSVGINPSLANQLGRSVNLYRIAGLALSNGLIAMSGALVSAQQGFSDINSAVGIVITLVASLVLGEGLLRSIRPLSTLTVFGRVAASIFGTLLYFALYLFILRASIRGWVPIDVQPTDLKLVSALFVVVAFVLRYTKSQQDDPLPL